MKQPNKNHPLNQQCPIISPKKYQVSDEHLFPPLKPGETRLARYTRKSNKQAKTFFVSQPDNSILPFSVDLD